MEQAKAFVEEFAVQIAEKWYRFYILKETLTPEKINKKTEPMNPYNVIEIKPLGDYKLCVTFADGKTNVVDFEPFFIKRPHPQYNQYHDPVRFLDYKLEYGNLV